MSDDDRENGNGAFDWGCCYPETCLMPGVHLKAECHTVEMVQERYEQHSSGGLDLNFYFDHLTHDLEPDQWAEEIEGGYVVTPRGEIDLRILALDPCLADPQMSAWNNAIVWQLVQMFGETATVHFRKPEPGVESPAAR